MTQHLTAEALRKDFLAIFGQEADQTFFSPGRINLIGEHTDYNGGHVFPAAISLGTYGAARKRDDQVLRFYSANFEDKGIIEVPLADLKFEKEHNWTNYPKGVLHFLQEAGHVIDKGFDFYVYGNIPNGAGLSSSASIELLMGTICNDLYALHCPMLELVQIGKKVENEFIGVNSGIMDQFAVGMGEKDQAILLDTNNMHYEMVPAKLGEYTIVIMNTNKRRELADSKYNERRAECEEAVRLLQKELSIEFLGELNSETFEQYQALIGDPTLIKRARHAVTENERTLLAKQALTEGDLEEFGLLLNASHRSLKEDYEVTGIELDTLVACAQEQPGVLGARMTGAGFGGCSIALVPKQNIDAFIEAVGQSYQDKIGYAADFYPASIDDGARKLF